MARTAGAYKVFRNRKAIHERKLARVVRGVLDRTVDQVLSRLRSGGSPVSSLPNGSAVGASLAQALKPSAVAACNAATLFALQSVEAAYGRPLPVVKAKQIRRWDETLIITKSVTMDDVANLGLKRTVANVFEPEALGKIKTIGAEYINDLRNHMKVSFEAGEGRPALIDRIMGFKDQNEYRATRIAQTESTRMFNQSSMDAYGKSTVVKEKQWIANMSSGRSRPEHEAAHEQSVPVDEPFIVGDEELMYPGDPAGSDWNVINCQCAMMPVIGAGTGAIAGLPDGDTII